MGAPIALYDVARPELMSSEGVNDELPPSYDLIRKEHMEEVLYDQVPKESTDSPSPQYETVASAQTGMTSSTTASSPPPLPPPKITEDSDASPLPPPFHPDSSTEEAGLSEERVRGDSVGMLTEKGREEEMMNREGHKRVRDVHSRVTWCCIHPPITNDYSLTLSGCVPIVKGANGLGSWFAYHLQPSLSSQITVYRIARNFRGIKFSLYTFED